MAGVDAGFVQHLIKSRRGAVVRALTVIYVCVRQFVQIGKGEGGLFSYELQCISFQTFSYL